VTGIFKLWHFLKVTQKLNMKEATHHFQIKLNMKNKTDWTTQMQPHIKQSDPYKTYFKTYSFTVYD